MNNPNQPKQNYTPIPEIVSSKVEEASQNKQSQLSGQSNNPYYSTPIQRPELEREQELANRVEAIKSNFGEGSDALNNPELTVKDLRGMGLDLGDALGIYLRNQQNQFGAKREALESDPIRDLSLNRSFLEGISDTALDVGVGGLRLGQAAYELANLITMPLFEEGTSLESITGLGEKATKGAEFLQKFQSEGMQAARTLFEVEMASEFPLTTTERAEQRAVKNGREEPSFVDYATEMMIEFGTAINVTRSNPTFVRSMIQENAVDLLGPGLVKKLLDGLGLVRSSKMLRDAAGKNKKLSPEEISAIQRTARREDTIIGSATITAQEGGLNASEARQQVMDMSHEELMKHDYYQGLIEKGLDEETAKRVVANNAFITTYGIAGAIAALSSLGTGAGRLEAALFRINSTTGRNVLGVPAKAIQAGAVEFGQETLQSGGGALAQNIAINLFADEDVKFVDGVAQEAGIGAVIGGMMGTGAGGLRGTVDALKDVANSKVVTNLREQGAVIKDVQAALKVEETQLSQDESTSIKSTEDTSADPNSFLTYSNIEDVENYDPIRTLAVLSHPDYLNNKERNADEAANLFRNIFEHGANALDTLDNFIETSQGTEEEIKLAKARKAVVTEQINNTALLVDLFANKEQGEETWVKGKKQILDALERDLDLEQEVSPEQIQEAFDYLGSDPEALPDYLIQKAIESDNKTIAEQGELFKKAKESMITLRNSLEKSTKEVRDEIFKGSEENLGLDDYKRIFNAASVINDTKTKEKYLSYLSNFADSHYEKAEMAKVLFENSKLKPEDRIPEYDSLAQEYREKYSRRGAKGEIVGDGAYIHHVKSKMLVEALQSESDAINALYDAIRANTDISAERITSQQQQQQQQQQESKTKAPQQQEPIQSREQQQQQSQRLDRNMDQRSEEMAETNNPLQQLNSVFATKLSAENARSRDVPLSENAQATEQAAIRLESELQQQGYEIVDHTGQPHTDSMNVIADYVQDSSLPKGQSVITKVKTPQINKDGDLIQTAEVVVSIGTAEQSITKAETAPSKTDGFINDREQKAYRARINNLPVEVISEKARENLLKLVDKNSEASIEKVIENLQRREADIVQETASTDTPLKSVNDSVIAKERAKEAVSEIGQNLEDSFSFENKEDEIKARKLKARNELNKPENVKKIVDLLMRNFGVKDVLPNTDLARKRAKQVSKAIGDVLKNTVNQNQYEKFKYYREAVNYLEKTLDFGNNIDRLDRNSAGRFSFKKTDKTESRSFGLKELFSVSEKNTPLLKDPDIVQKLTTKKGVRKFVKENNLNAETAKFLSVVFQPYANKFIETAREMYKYKSAGRDTLKTPISVMQNYKTKSIDDVALLALAIHSMNWLNNSGRADFQHDLTYISYMFGLKDANDVTADQRKLAEFIGKGQEEVYKEIGMDFAKSLGLSRNKKTESEMPGIFFDSFVVNAGQLAVDVMASSAMNILEKQRVNVAFMEEVTGLGYFPEGTKFNEVTGEVIPVYTNESEHDIRRTQDSGTVFIRIKPEFEQKNESIFPVLPERIKRIHQLYDSQETESSEEGTKDFSTLFEGTKEPSWPIFEAREFKQELLKNSVMRVPKRIKDILSKKQKRSYGVNSSMSALINNVSKETILKVGGYISDPESRSAYHRAKEGEAKNRDLEINYDNAIAWMQRMQEQGKSEFYISEVVWKNFRQGLKGVINPQNSKLHRHLFGYNDHKRSYKSDNVNERLYLVTAFAQALGFKIDTKNMKGIYSQMGQLLMPMLPEQVENLPKNTREYRISLQSLLQNLKIMEENPNEYDDSVREQTEALIEDVVNRAGEGYHSLHGVLELARAYDYIEDSDGATGFVMKSGEFESDMVIEIDGKTNGSAFTIFQLMDRNLEYYENLLKKVGVYLDNEATTVNEYFENNPNEKDIYETLGEEWFSRLQKHVSRVRMLKEKPHLIKKDEDAEFVDNIHLIEGALELFGDLTENKRSASKDPVMTTIYGQGYPAARNKYAEERLGEFYEKVMAGNVDPATLDKMEIKLNKKQLQDLAYNRHEFRLTPQQEKAIIKGVFLSHGAALETALKYGPISELLDRQRMVNTVINANFEIFKKRYNALVEKYKKDNNGFEPSQETKISFIEELGDVAPIYQSHFSTNEMEGTNAMKRGFIENPDSAMLLKYKNHTINLKGATQESYKKGSSSSSTAYSTIQQLESPGVGGFVALIHSYDASTMLEFLDGDTTAVNIHDAIIISPQDLVEASESINKHFLDVSMNNRIIEMVMGKFIPIKEEYLDYLVNEVAKKSISKAEYLEKSIETALDNINPGITEEARKDVLSRITAVNQYSSADGGYFPVSPIMSPQEIGKKAAEDIKEQLQKPDDDNLGSTPDGQNNTFKPNRTETATQEGLRSLFNELTILDDTKLNESHRERLGRVGEVLFKFVEGIEIRLQEKANRNLGRYKISDRSIDLKVSDPRITTNSDSPATETYMHELTHAALQQALKVSSLARKRYEHVYEIVADKIPRDWFVDKNAPKADQERALSLYDYIFGSTTRRSMKRKDPISGVDRSAPESAGLDEFVAFALTNERMIEFLERPDIKKEILKGARRGYVSSESGSSIVQLVDSVVGYLYNLLLDAINTFSNKVISRLDSSQSAESMMLSMAKQIAETHQNTINRVNRKPGFFSKANKKIADVSSAGIRKGLKTSAKALKKSGNIGAAIGNTIENSLAAMNELGERNFLEEQMGVENNKESNAGMLLGLLSDMRRRMGVHADSLLASLGREMVGQIKENRIAYALQRLSTNHVDTVMLSTTRIVGNVLNAAYGSPLNRHQKSSLGRVLLNTDLQSLLIDDKSVLDMTDEEHEAYMSDPSNKQKRIDNFNYIRRVVEDNIFRAQEIARIESEISNLMGNNKAHTVHYLKMARSLGVDMVTGDIEQDHQMRNAYAIAQLYGSTLKPTGLEGQAEGLIDKLSTLVALDTTRQDDRDNVAKIFDSEINTHNKDADSNGIMVTLSIAAKAQKDSMNVLFNGNKTQMIKGYTKQTMDDRVTVVLAEKGSEKARELLNDGYTLVGNSALGKDPDDDSITGKNLHLFISTSGKTRSYLKQVMNLNSNSARGVNIAEVILSAEGINGLKAANVGSNIDNIRQSKLAKLHQNRMKTEATKGIKLRPILDPDGNIVDYVYTMNENTKKVYMDKQDMFDLALGSTMGAIESKPKAEAMNELAITTLKTIYSEEFDKNPSRFVKISANAVEAENREYWYMLPYPARQAAKAAFGGDYIMIPDDMRKLFFGYRKQTSSDLLKKAAEKRVEAKGQKDMWASVFNNMAKTMELPLVRTIEEFWQELVSMAKDAIVIKTGAVLVANIMSNNVVLAMEGLNPIKIAKYQKEGWDAITSYQLDIEQIEKLKLKLASDRSIGLDEKKRIKDKISRLEVKLSRNPAFDLLTSGVYQSIVEDINMDEEYFTFKNSMERKLEPLMENVPDIVKDAGNMFFITHNTRLYKILRSTTQKSDFVARYALHKHNLENGMNYSDSINRIMDSFVDYETPTHPTIQYLNDMGLLMFTKFFFRIQKVLLRQMSEKSAEVFMFFMLKGMTGIEVPSIFDVMGTKFKNWFNRMYTPFDNLQAIMNGNMKEFNLQDGLGYMK